MTIPTNDEPNIILTTANKNLSPKQIIYKKDLLEKLAIAKTRKAKKNIIRQARIETAKKLDAPKTQKTKKLSKDV